MKIALLTTDAREHYREYTKKQPYFGTAPEALLEGFAQIPEAEVEVVSCVQRPFETPVQLAPNIRYHALLVPKIGWMRTGFQGCIRAVRRKLRELKPDIVHGQGTERDCAISAIKSQFPNVLTIHGNMAELARHCGHPFLSHDWLAAKLEDYTLPQSAGVFCNSAYTEALVKPRAKRVWRVANAIRRKFFDTPISSAPAGHPIIVNVGVVCPRKRQVEILGVAEELHKAGKIVEFQFIGLCTDGSEYERTFLERVAIGEKLGYVRWLGTMGSDAMIDCFDGSLAALHFPSEEAFGLVVAEAMARNLKFFGARLGGIQDIVAGAELAELYDANDWAGLRRGIEGWLDAGAPRPATAVATMKERYAPHVIARRHMEIYNEVLSGAA